MLLRFVSLSEQCNPETRLVEKKIRSTAIAKTIKPVENKGGLVDFKQTWKGVLNKLNKLKGKKRVGLRQGVKDHVFIREKQLP